jgi:hypothetical protein
MTPRPYRLKRRKHVINLDDVAVGDQIELTDKAGNRVSGKVGGSNGQPWTTAFDTRILFAKLGADGKWRAAPHITIAWHQPSLIGQGLV